MSSQDLRPNFQDVQRRYRGIRRSAAVTRTLAFALIAVVLAGGVILPLRALQSILRHEQVGTVGTQTSSPPTPSPTPDMTTFTDNADKLSVTAPASWSFSADPVPNVLDPKIDFALGSEPFVTGGECGPDPALQSLSPTGVFVWVVEYSATEVTPDLRSSFASSAEAATFEAEPSQPECAASRPSFALLFSSGQRYFEVHAAYGDETLSADHDLVASIVKSITVGA